jgi:folylpolyglutamate synthase/dihydropteroate synthase
VEALRATLAGWSSRFGVFPDKLKLELQRGALTLIVGFLGDKDWRPMCEILAPLAGTIFTVPVASARTADANELATVFHAANPAARVIAFQNFSKALDACKKEPFVMVTGSLYLIGEALELLGHSLAGVGERGLNEWSGRR